MNKFMLLPLTLWDGARELPVGERVAVGRRSHPQLVNLHISREQVCFELKPDVDGRILICMTNVRRCVGRPHLVGRSPLPPPTRPASPVRAVAHSAVRTARAC